MISGLKRFSSVLRALGFAFLLCVLAYVSLLIYSYPHYKEEQLDSVATQRIESERLTKGDVDGARLPSPAEKSEVDATIAGVDENGNGIRDDVELAIFAHYPTSPSVRAAELQYAMELQNELTSVFDSATLVAVIRAEGRGFLCISNDQHAKEVEDLVFNTDARKSQRERIREKYM